MPLCISKDMFLDLLIRGITLELVGFVFKVVYVYNVDNQLVVFHLNKIVGLNYIGYTRVNLGLSKNSVYPCCESLLLNHYVTVVLFELCDHSFHIYGTFEVLELMDDVLRVVYFLDALCSGTYIIIASGRMRQLELIALKHLVILGFKSSISACSILLSMCAIPSILCRGSLIATYFVGFEVHPREFLNDVDF